MLRHRLIVVVRRDCGRDFAGRDWAAIGEYHRSFRQSGREHVGLTGQGGKYNPGWYQSPKPMTENQRTKRFTSPTDPAVIRLSLVEFL